MGGRDKLWPINLILLYRGHHMHLHICLYGNVGFFWSEPCQARGPEVLAALDHHVYMYKYLQLVYIANILIEELKIASWGIFSYKLQVN